MCVRFIYYSCDIDVEIFMSPRLFIIDVCWCVPTLKKNI
jgi:hypothetical protein